MANNNLLRVQGGTKDIICILRPTTDEALLCTSETRNAKWVRVAMIDPHEQEIPCIALHLDNLPYDAEVGYCFGSLDDDNIDVLLDKDSGASRDHFRININWTSNQVMLQGHSKYGTVLQSALYTTRKVIMRDQKIPLLHGDQIQAGFNGFDVLIPEVPESSKAKWNLRKAEVIAAIGDKPSKTSDQEQTLISANEITILRNTYLGDGAFSQVFKGLGGDGNAYAVKMFLPGVKGKNYRTEENLGLDVLGGLIHPNVIRLFPEKRVRNGDPRRDHIIMEFAENGTLETNIPYNPFEFTQAVSQICKALSYLHEKNITHRDLKPTNILVAQRRPLKVKICDFGLASSDKEMRSFLGTGHYLSKYQMTSIRNNETYDRHCDVWAAGIIILSYASFYWPDLEVTKDPSSTDFDSAFIKYCQEISEIPNAMIRKSWLPLVRVAKIIMQENTTSEKAHKLLQGLLAEHVDWSWRFNQAAMTNIAYSEKVQSYNGKMRSSFLKCVKDCVRVDFRAETPFMVNSKLFNFSSTKGIQNSEDSIGSKDVSIDSMLCSLEAAEKVVEHDLLKCIKEWLQDQHFSEGMKVLGATKSFIDETIRPAHSLSRT